MQSAFVELFPDKVGYSLSVKYSGKFRGYNANIRMRGSDIVVNMSRNWRGVSPEIQKGLIQELLIRLFKVRMHTINMDLYHHFIKGLPKVAPKTQSHPVLERSFERVNAAFFAGMVDRPNLRLGSGVLRLGTYEYATDTVTITEMLLAHEELMDYVMYHELLHKKHQYSAKGGRHAHHSRQFREDEAKFPRADELEKELQRLARTQKSVWKFW
ncbi:M48 family metallopeptidase [Candidatus Woesearchaeota archaeon]|nr:M48 family metallopeptidase [Candidatus Woesearchaeota archaeon]